MSVIRALTTCRVYGQHRPAPPAAGRLVRCAGLLLLLSSMLFCTQSQPPIERAPAARSSASRAISVLFQGSTAGGGQARHARFFSRALGRQMDYWLYLPPGYGSSTQSYPVLYMLHGRGGSSAQWPSFGLFDQADRLIRGGQIAPLIIVTPEGDDGYWMNHANQGPRWGDYVTTDLVAYVDATYRTLPDRTHRALGGVSMGGHGAIELALTHPTLFAVVGGHSPVFRRQNEAFPFFGVGAVYQHHDPISLVRDLGVGVPFQLWLDMGDQDPWLRSTLAFHQLLAQRGIAHTWHLWPGGHQETYWERHVVDYLCWYDVALHGRPGTSCGAGGRPVQAARTSTRAHPVPRR